MQIDRINHPSNHTLLKALTKDANISMRVVYSDHIRNCPPNLTDSVRWRLIWLTLTVFLKWLNARPKQKCAHTGGFVLKPKRHANIKRMIHAIQRVQVSFHISLIRKIRTTIKIVSNSPSRQYTKSQHQLLSAMTLGAQPCSIYGPPTIQTRSSVA